jgi:serine/threonine-protein kinase RsbW
MVEKTVPAALPFLTEALKFIRLAAAKAQLSEEDQQKIELASEEAISNIIEHGYKGKEGTIEIECSEVESSTFQVKISDSAIAFDQTSTIPAHDESDPFHNGTKLMHSLLDSFSYERVCDKNILTLLKVIVQGYGSEVDDRAPSEMRALNTREHLLLKRP